MNCLNDFDGVITMSPVWRPVWRPVWPPVWTLLLSTLMAFASARAATAQSTLTDNLSSQSVLTASDLDPTLELNLFDESSPTESQDDMEFDPGNVFAELDLEQLMDISVTSVTGVKDSWFQTPAALDVITSEEIRRSGHQSIPEALRLSPGLHVARINKSNWAISSRGFTSRFGNKLQVLIDGRRIYDPLFSGVFWGIQDYVLEDIDRIEVIRGPGATLWGANAVNGVINITTKSAADTQGLYITGGGGNELQGFGAVRYGGRINDDASYRVYGKYRNYDNSDDIAGGERPDDWNIFQGGFRLDFEGDHDTSFTLQGDAVHLPRGGEGVLSASPAGHLMYDAIIGDRRVTGGNVLMRIKQQINEDDQWRLQVYYDRTDRAENSGLEYTRNSIDVDFRHHVHFGQNHEVIWGLGYRHDRDDVENTPPTFIIDPDERSLDTFSAFLQDTITLQEDRWFAMLGAKVEENDFTGFEVQPNARLWWTPDDRQTLWASISRPVRTPSRVEDDITVLHGYADPGLLAGGPPAGFLIPLTFSGDRSVESEVLLSHELGYRRRVTDELTIDIAAFYNDYERLIGLRDFMVFDNLNDGETYGVEIAANWHVAENWRLYSSYSFMRQHIHGPDDDAMEGNYPPQQFQVHSELDITEDLEFNSALYFVDDLPGQRTSSHLRLDLGMTWRPTHNLEIAIWGQNLLDPRHMEFEPELFLTSPSEVERSVYLQATLRF